MSRKDKLLGLHCPKCKSEPKFADAHSGRFAIFCNCYVTPRHNTENAAVETFKQYCRNVERIQQQPGEED